MLPRVEEVANAALPYASRVGSMVLAIIIACLWVALSTLQQENKELRQVLGQTNVKPSLDMAGLANDFYLFLLMQVASIGFVLYVLAKFVRQEYQKLLITHRALLGVDKEALEQFSYASHFESRLDYWFSASHLSKPIALIVLTALLILVGSIVMSIVSSQPFGLSMWKTWTYVADPGTHADVEDISMRIVAIFVTIGGMLVFAVLVGIVAEEIGSAMDNLKKGKSQVSVVHHTLILGWNDKIIPIIKELALANESEGGGTIVVLSTRDKIEMEQDIVNAEIDLKGTEIVCRSGSPLQTSDLKKVSATLARSMIVLVNDTAVDADAADAKCLRVVLCIVGLMKSVGRLPSGHIVVELMDIDNKPLIDMVGHGWTESVVTHDVVGRLMIQSSLQPAVAHVLAELLSFDGNEIYFSEWPELIGITFEEVVYRFDRAIPFGIKTVTGEILINPDPSLVIQDGDKIIVVAEDDDTYTASKHPLFIPNELHKKQLRVVLKEKPKRLMFCGWRRDIDDMIVELDKVLPSGSELHILSPKSLAARQIDLTEGGLKEDELKNIHLVHTVGKSVVRRNLEKLPLEVFDSILILADQTSEHSIEDADSRSLATLLLIRDIQKERLGRTSSNMIVSEILDARTRGLVKVADIADYVMSNDIVSSYIAQVSENRDANTIWKEILTDEGNEVYVRPIRSYRDIVPNRPYSFWEIIAICPKIRRTFCRIWVL
eukprot:CFRG1921T1